MIIGLLIFFVPFFTYLSTENLKQLSRTGVLEIFLSLIALLIVILISSFSIEMLIKRFFKKKIILFPLFCFAFYLNFFFTPFLETLQEFLRQNNGSNSIGIPVFIFFELCCLAIIAFGAKFNAFSIRIILIFSILMLIKTFIPLVGYLAENIGKKPTISYEINSGLFAQDAVPIKRNVYYIIIDAMSAIETVEPFNIATKKEVESKLSDTELKYIDKSQSSYTDTKYSLTSLMLVDYNQKASSSKNIDKYTFYPFMMYNKHIEIPLISYLTKANSSFYWTGQTSDVCRPSMIWICIDSVDGFLPQNLLNFYFTTPINKIYGDLFIKTNKFKKSIDEVLKYIDKNGVPETPFFAFIHDVSAKPPFLVTNECEPTNYFNQYFEGYKAAYHCTLEKVKMFMEKINNLDPEAIVVFQGDHGVRESLNLELTEKEKYLLEGSIFNAIKAPEICFEKYGLPTTTVNTMRFVLNCAYGFKLPYMKNIHYENKIGDGAIVVERKLYE
jgi:hypothetical protein